MQVFLLRIVVRVSEWYILSELGLAQKLKPKIQSNPVKLYIPDDFENVEEYESDSDVEVDSDILDEWLNNGKVNK